MVLITVYSRQFYFYFYISEHRSNDETTNNFRGERGTAMAELERWLPGNETNTHPSVSERKLRS